MCNETIICIPDGGYVETPDIFGTPAAHATISNMLSGLKLRLDVDGVLEGIDVIVADGLTSPPTICTQYKTLDGWMRKTPTVYQRVRSWEKFPHLGLDLT